MKTKFAPAVFTVQKCLDSILENDKYAFSLTNYKRIKKILDKSATKHSNEIEHPIEHLPAEYKKIMKNAKQKAFTNHLNAWKFAKEYVESGKELNIPFIAKTLLLLEPEQQLNWNTGTRSSEVRITGSPHQPPSPKKVPSELNTMIHSLKELNSPLEKAIYAHYHLARIHPGEDGNGRCSRIVQNAYLYDKNYLPIVIKSEDRKKYLSVLAQTDKKYYENDNSYLYTFSNFLAQRMKQSIETYTRDIIIIGEEETGKNTTSSTSSNNISKNKRTSQKYYYRK